VLAFFGMGLLVGGSWFPSEESGVGSPLQAKLTGEAPDSEKTDREAARRLRIQKKLTGRLSGGSGFRKN
jgi:hypothetical protein